MQSNQSSIRGFTYGFNIMLGLIIKHLRDMIFKHFIVHVHVLNIIIHVSMGFR